MTDRAVPLPLLRARLRRGPPAWPARAGNESGAAILEFSLVVVLFVFLLYGLIFFGMLLATKQGITNAAADGARSAIGAVPIPPETPAQAQIRVAKATVQNHLGSLYDSPEPTVGFCNGASGPQCITVTVQRNDPPVPPSPGLGLLWDSSKSIKSTAVVQVSS